MEEQILQEIKEIESELGSINKRISGITYELEHISPLREECKCLRDEKQECAERFSKLDTLRREKWKKLYEEKLKLFPNILHNPVMKEILKYDYDCEDNYRFLKLVEKAPSIYTDVKQTSAVYRYVTHNRACASPNIDQINKLMKLDARVFENPDFKTIITDVAFDYVDNVFCTPELVDNNDFISYFIKYMKENWFWCCGYYNTEEMVQALQANLDYELVANLGSKEMLNKYLSQHMSEGLLGKIATIQNQSLKNYILSHIFEFGDKTLTILSKFLEFPEIRKQILDENSLYYYMLVGLATPDDDTKYYGAKAGLFTFRDSYDIFYDFQFDQMVHYFDTLVGHYIYFYSNDKVYQVPLLAYIKNCRKKIDDYIHIDMLVNSIDITDDELEKLKKKHHNLLHSSFKDLCIQALSRSTRETLTQEQIDEWDHLLEVVPAEIEDDNYSKVIEIEY